MEKSRKRIITGSIVRDSMEKTGALIVVRNVMHPKYKKNFKQSKKYLFHDLSNVCKTGDKASIIESRKISKTKCWRLFEHQPKKETELA